MHVTMQWNAIPDIKYWDVLELICVFIHSFIYLFIYFFFMMTDAMLLTSRMETATFGSPADAYYQH